MLTDVTGHYSFQGMKEVISGAILFNLFSYSNIFNLECRMKRLHDNMPDADSVVSTVCRLSYFSSLNI
ncbi:unnamed protein product, partial [Heterobilharzia americana]